MDGSGALYGTTEFGGNGSCFRGCGTVFKLTPSGGAYVESILYTFQGPSAKDGAGPAAGVVADARGALYGTTEYRGNGAGDGTAFKLSPSGSKYVETILHRFKGDRDGTSPFGGLTMEANGTLFGTTLLGGGASACGQNASGGFVGCGTVFELKPLGANYRERILYRFQSGTDGATPGSAPIFVEGILYGTAATGGGNPSCGGAPINPGCGSVYKLAPRNADYTFGLIHTFTGMRSDGANPFGGLVAEGHRFCGSTQYGGEQNQGTVFSLTGGGSGFTETTLHSFAGGNDGSYPLAGLALRHGTTLYGTTEYGGRAYNAGVLFDVRPSASGWVEHILQRFDNLAGGEYPIGGILTGKRGALYGTTSYGGTASASGGTVFELRNPQSGWRRSGSSR